MPKQLMLVGSGIVLIIAAVIVRSGPRSFGRTPGRLVARIAQVNWRSPQDKNDSQASRPRFELQNVGGKVVHVLEVTSSCGCATPRVEPRVIPPGASAIVEVEADTLELGDKSVPIVVKSDSKDDPYLELTLNIHGRQRPPYVARATGDLYYRSGYSVGESRSVGIDVIEPMDVAHNPPPITVDAYYFKVGVPTSKPTERIYAPDPKMKVFSWEIPLELASQPPAAGFQGTAIVHDPWIKGRSIEIPIHGEADPPVRIIPARLALTLSSGNEGTAVQSAMFMVRTKRPGLPLTLKNASGDEGPLMIEAVDRKGQDKHATFRLSLKPGKAVPQGVYEVVVYVEGYESEKAVVPVLVK